MNIENSREKDDVYGGEEDADVSPVVDPLKWSKPLNF
jgi:hypothetical protein